MAEVTNPGQNESQQTFAFCDRLDKEEYILDRDSSPNESPDRVKEEERGWMIGQNPKNVSGNRDKEFSLVDRGHRERTGESRAKLRAKKKSLVLGQQLVWQDVLTLWQSSGWRSEIEIADASNRAP